MRAKPSQLSIKIKNGVIFTRSEVRALKHNVAWEAEPRKPPSTFSFLVKASRIKRKGQVSLAKVANRVQRVEEILRFYTSMRLG